MYSSKQIRKKYLNFFKAKNHQVIPSASLIPENDPTTLFTGSGMQPLLPYLLGEKHPAGKRLVDIQKCFRTDDIDKVGDSRHNTFFEMMGNWSLGDYFRKEQLAWLFAFLTETLQLNPERFYITVFRGNKDLGIPKDTESVEIWKRLFSQVGIKAKDIDFAEKNGMQGGRIFYYSEDKNWWSRAGVPGDMPVGEPGGPDSEIFYDLGVELRCHENSPYARQPCHPNCDCGRFVEMGNSVFMEYKKVKHGFEKLAQKNIDFGGGLERITMVVQNKSNVFETDLFSPIIKKIEVLSAKRYRQNIKAFEVIADHLRAAIFIMGDDRAIAPSNTDQGYLVRRLIRRAIRFGRQLQIKSKPWTVDIAQIVIKQYADVYPELANNRKFIVEQLNQEELKFQKTLTQGLKKFEQLANKKRISGREAFDLYQSYGLPFEITCELAKERGIKLDEKCFKRELKKHQELSRRAAAGKFKGGLADSSEQAVKLHTATHLLLAALRRVLGDKVVQKGSNITAERLRFDFSYTKRLTDIDKQKIERLVNEAIKKDLKVNWRELTLEQARKKGAIGVFGHKYGQKVKVYSIGEGQELFSQEICGGPHVKSTGVLGRFKITKEEGIGGGVRRIRAVLLER